MAILPGFPDFAMSVDFRQEETLGAWIVGARVEMARPSTPQLLHRLVRELV